MNPAPVDQGVADPAKIYQMFLDETSDMILKGDVAPVADRFTLPFLFRTTAGETVIESRDDLISDMTGFARSLQTQGVTHYIRLVRKARHLSETMIEGWHVSHLLRRAVTVVPPYGSRMVLRQDGDIWRVAESEHELANSQFPVDLLRAHPGGFSGKWAAPMADIRTDRAQAEPIYQVFLDSLSETVHRRDFNDWCAHFTMPHHVHYDAADHTVNAPDDVKPFFDQLCAQMEDLGADRIERRASGAEFISGDRIVGYHDTELTKDGMPVFGPVKSRMILCQHNGQWACSSVTNSLSNIGFPGSAFQVSETLPTLREIQERNRK